MANPSPVTNAGSLVRPGSPWSNTSTVNRPGGSEGSGVSWDRYVPLELGRIQEDLGRRLAVGGSDEDGINNAVKPDRLERVAPSSTLVPVS